MIPASATGPEVSRPGWIRTVDLATVDPENLAGDEGRRKSGAPQTFRPTIAPDGSVEWPQAGRSAWVEVDHEAECDVAGHRRDNLADHRSHRSLCQLETYFIESFDHEGAAIDHPIPLAASAMRSS